MGSANPGCHGAPPARDGSIVRGVGPDLPADPALPVGDLLGDGGRRLIERHLAGAGLTLLDARPVAMFYRPEQSVVARFTAQVRPSPPAGGKRTGEDGEGSRGPDREETAERLTVAVACDQASPPQVWTFPDDPDLPGLPAAHRPPPAPRPLRRRAQEDEPAASPEAVEMIRYRPRRRAVLRYRLARERVLYAKVLPPGRARHTLTAAERIRPGTGGGALRLALAAPGPAPGALLVPALAGRPLRDLLLVGESLPHPARLARLSDDLAALCSPAPARPLPASPARVSLSSATEAARLAGHLLPGLRATAASILEVVAQGVEAGPAVEGRPVHGDLYEAQVLLGEGGTLGLVDLDDLGLGDPLLDAATFSAHLAALALAAPDRAGGIRAYRFHLRRAFLDHLGADDRALRWREAYALLLLAPGPFRALRPDWPSAVTDRMHVAAALLREGKPARGGRTVRTGRVRPR